MKILFDNILKTKQILSVNASANYPARNLTDNFLRLRYQVNTTSDSLTILLGETVTIDCLYMGYIGNLNDIKVSFFSGGAVLDVVFDSQHITEPGVLRIFEEGVLAMFGGGPSDYFDDYDRQEFTSRHFAPITGVDEIRIDYTGTNPFFVGGIAAGLCTDMPPAIVQWEDSYRDNSVVTTSAQGQVLPQYIEPLKQFVFTFESVSYSEFLALKEKFRSVGPKPVWVTFFEESENEYPPGYYQVEMRGQQRDRLTYIFSVTFTEAR